jgi:hypothetical protein
MAACDEIAMVNTELEDASIRGIQPEEDRLLAGEMSPVDLMGYGSVFSWLVVSNDWRSAIYPQTRAIR